MKTSFYLMASLSLALTGLLASCGSSAPPPLETLSGEWVDTKARAEVCGETSYIGLQMDLSLESDGESVYGDIALINDYGDFYFGSFSGRAASSGKLTGTAEFFDDWSYEFILFNADLTFKSSGVSGTLTEVDGVECEDGRPGKFSIEVNFQRGSDKPGEPQTPTEDDALEPNNNREEAAEIELDYRADLVLQDDDWFTFTLSEEQLLTVGVEADNFYTYANLYDDAQNQVVGFELGAADFASARSIQLPAGTYYLSLDGDDVPRNQSYTLILSSGPLPDAALEPNNTSESATEMSADFTQQMFLSQDDEDWFSFTLTDARLVTFDLGDSSYDLSYALYNADLETYRGSSYRGDAFTLTLEAGKHYLRVYNYSSFSDGGLIYPVTLSSKPLPDAALEPNNSFNTATSLSLPYSADLYMTESDQDWFSFTLTEEQLVTLERSDKNYSDLSGTFYTDEGTKIDGGRTFSLYAAGAVSFILPADTYYVSLSNSRYSGDNFAYALSITSEGVPDLEYEPNDTRETAHPVSLDFADGNLLVSEDDEDWFSFTLESTTQVDFVLKDSGSGLPNLDLYEEGEYDPNYNLRYDDQSPVLAPGTYYVRVSTYGITQRYGFSIRKSQ